MEYFKHARTGQPGDKRNWLCSKSSHGQNVVERAIEAHYIEDSCFLSKNKLQHGRYHKAWNRNAEYGKDHGHIINQSSVIECSKETQHHTYNQRHNNSNQTQLQGSTKRIGDQPSYLFVLHLHRNPEITLGNIFQILSILYDDRLIQAILFHQAFPNLRWHLLLRHKRVTRNSFHQEKGCRDENKQRN
ncbi:hypothetical protein D3C81_937260 [compost metagenome]